MSLRALQRDFRTWLTTEGADAAHRLAGARAAGPAVYLNNYRGQLMASLSESFAATRAWLGDAAFEAAAAHHIERRPPHSWTLDAYAVGFPETLATLYPGDAEIHELACLEMTLGVVFVGPDADPIDPAILPDVDWDRASILFLPTLRIVPATTNAAAIWSAIAAGHVPPPAESLPEPAALAIWRQGFTPSFRTIERGEAEAIRALQQGASFGTLCAEAIARWGEEQGPMQAGAWLGEWIRDGIIARIEAR
ncbi:HvfC/BufC N-terminal domain-containing protein [Sphingomonas morindae]|uniref:DNA-binding domain-containing protein n=1 Tax=Sphingomonas morindae TaxID=1541170 RepID=A0ABY4X9B7_9SPHN|nr:DNA-binding domain-containing protein [Sphingomonas morindae]USI73494.1 DNA-binding domain-containing protein [Sphingomonas morindae]